MEHIKNIDDVSTQLQIVPVFKRLSRKSQRSQFLPLQINKKNIELNKLYIKTNFINAIEKQNLDKTLSNVSQPRSSRIHSRQNELRSIITESQLNQKINFGSLTYLSFKEKEDTNNIRTILHQKEVLLNSNNFLIGKDINTITNGNLNKSVYSSTNRSLSSNKKRHYLNNHSSDQLKNRVLRTTHKTQNSSLVSYSNTPNISINQCLTNRSSSTKTPCQTERKTVNYHKKLNIHKEKFKREYKEKLSEKIENLDHNRIKNLKQLFALIDRTKVNQKKKISLDLKKDIEEILQVKVNEKKEKTKDDFLQAVHLKDGNFFRIGSVKARMLNLSDKINKITDEEALVYAERIAEEYFKNSKKAGLGLINFENGNQIDLSAQNNKNVIENNIRMKIGINNRKIYRMRMKINQEKIKIINKIDNILNHDTKNFTILHNNSPNLIHKPNNDT